MHAPDGFYSVGLCLATDAICLGIIVYCFKRVWGKISKQGLLLAASVGTLVFAMELANIPVTRGSSCHFMGGVFAAIVLGPFLGTIVVSLMHIVQFFVFQDGGLLALGPNLLTISIASTFFGYYLYRIFKTLVIEPYGKYLGAFVSTWLTLLITSLTVSVMLVISGVDSLTALIGPMVGPHVLVGLIEGIITVVLLGLLSRMSPGALSLPNENLESMSAISKHETGRKAWQILLALAILVGVLVSPFASRAPDGLEKMALDRGFFQGHEVVYYSAPLAEYEIPGVSSEHMGKAMSGLLGTLITFGICWGVGAILVHKRDIIPMDVKMEKAPTH